MVDGRWLMVDGRWSMVDGRCEIDHRSSIIMKRPDHRSERPPITCLARRQGDARIQPISNRRDRLAIERVDGRFEIDHRP
jgi:hypothetical protein